MWPALQIVRCAQSAARAVVTHTHNSSSKTALSAPARAAVVGMCFGRRYRCTASAAANPVLVDVTDNGLFASVTLNR